MKLTLLSIIWGLCMQNPPDTLDAGKVTSVRDAATVSSVVVRKAGAEELQRSGLGSVDEVLKGWAGVNVRDYGGLGGLKSVSVRGLGAEHTMVSRDGVLVSDACNGQIDISRFSLDEVGELSLSMGCEDIFRPARTAIAAGIIEISSRKPLFGQGRIEARVRGGAASFASLNGSASINYKLTDKWYSGVSGEISHSEGNYPFSIRNASGFLTDTREGGDALRCNGRLTFEGDLNNGGKLQAHAGFDHSERGLPGAVVFYAQKPQERLWDNNFNADISYRGEFAEGWKLRSDCSVAFLGNTYRNESPLYPEPQVDNYMQREISGSAVLMRSFRGGLSVSIAEDLYINDLHSNIPYCILPVRLSSYGAVSASYEMGTLKAVAILQRTAVMEWAAAAQAADPRFRVSPAVSLAWNVFRGLTLRASCREGYRIPTFNDLYYARVGNRSLESEKALQTGIGAGYGLYRRGLSFRANTDLYWNEVRDKIVAVPTMWVWKMRNLGRVRMTGGESSVALILWKRGCRLHMDASGAVQRAIDISDPTAKNYRHQIQYTPLLSGNMSAGAEYRGMGVEYRLQAVGERFYLPQNIAANRLEPYCDQSLSVYKNMSIMGMDISISFSALNLGNINYEIIHGYPMPGRSYRLSIKIKYV